jgi:hypothetical protein
MNEYKDIMPYAFYALLELLIIVFALKIVIYHFHESMMYLLVMFEPLIGGGNLAL